MNLKNWCNVKNGQGKHDKPLEDFELHPINMYPIWRLHFSPHNQNQYQTAYKPPSIGQKLKGQHQTAEADSKGNIKHITTLQSKSGPIQILSLWVPPCGKAAKAVRGRDSRAYRLICLSKLDTYIRHQFQHKRAELKFNIRHENLDYNFLTA